MEPPGRPTARVLRTPRTTGCRSPEPGSSAQGATSSSTRTTTPPIRRPAAVTSWSRRSRPMARTFCPLVNPNTTALTGDCAGAAIQDCVTDNEGISGNQVVDPSTGNVYIAHTVTTEGSGGEVGVRVSEGKITLGTPTTATWSESPNLDASLCAEPHLRRCRRQPRGARGRELREHRARRGRLPVRDVHGGPAGPRLELRSEFRRPQRA